MVVTALATGVLAIIIGNLSFGSTHRPTRPSSSTRPGLVKGDDVRIAGVKVGSVKGISIVDRTRAMVTFDVQSNTALTQSTHADIRYRNLVGQRYIALTNEIGSTGVLEPGSTIPVSQHLAGARPDRAVQRVQAAVPGAVAADVNELSYEIIQVFQGQGGTLNGMLAHTASITQTLADRDQVIGQLITNLNSVLDHVGKRNRQLNQLITTFQQFVGGLKKDRGAILGSLDQISEPVGADRRPGLGHPRAVRLRHPPPARLRGQPRPAARPEIDRALQVLPIKLTKVGRTAIYGSWFNFYLCNFTGQIRIGKTAVPVSLQHRLGQVQSRMSTPFRERNPVVVGAISLAVVLGLILLAFNAEKLPIIGGGDTYYADFSEAGGLKANDEVRIAGVRVGKVDSVSLDGDHVKVAFRIDSGADFGTDTRAAIKVKTLLGAMYLSLEPAGAGPAAEGQRDPGLPHLVAVRRGAGVLGPRPHLGADRHPPARAQPDHAGRPDPQHPDRTSVRRWPGVSALSSNLAARNEQIGTLLQNLRSVTTTLNARDQDIVGLMQDSAVLFKALVKRRQAVHNLLRSTSQLSVELTKLVSQSRADLKPALTHLSAVVDVLNKNSDNIDQSIRLMGPFYRVFANTLGNGPWFDTYIQNIPPVPQVGG